MLDFFKKLQEELKKFQENTINFFRKHMPGKKDKEGKSALEEVSEEIKEETTDFKEDFAEAKKEIKEEIEDFKEDVKEFVDTVKDKFSKDDSFLEKYGKEASIGAGAVQLCNIMDYVAKSGDTQEIDLKDGNSLIVEQNDQGNIELFNSNNPEKPILSFDENLNASEPKIWDSIKGLMDSLTQPSQEKTGLDKILEDASKETSQEINNQAPGTKEMNQLLNSLQEMMNPTPQQK